MKEVFLKKSFSCASDVWSFFMHLKLFPILLNIHGECFGFIGPVNYITSNILLCTMWPWSADQLVVKLLIGITKYV